MLRILNRPGVRSVAEMRQYFEGAVRQTGVLTKFTSLEAATCCGEFSHYLDRGTDALWAGFALGMRGADQLAANAATPSTGEPTT
jgi:hypothetical protein